MMTWRQKTLIIIETILSQHGPYYQKHLVIDLITEELKGYSKEIHKLYPFVSLKEILKSKGIE